MTTELLQSAQLIGGQIRDLQDKREADRLALTRLRTRRDEMFQDPAVTAEMLRAHDAKIDECQRSIDLATPQIRRLQLDQVAAQKREATHDDRPGAMQIVLDDGTSTSREATVSELSPAALAKWHREKDEAEWRRRQAAAQSKQRYNWEDLP